MSESNTKYLNANVQVVSSLTRALDNAAEVLKEHKVTGYLLVLNYNEVLATPTNETELVESYDLSINGDATKLLKNAQHGAMQAAIEVSKEQIHKDKNYH